MLSSAFCYASLLRSCVSVNHHRQRGVYIQPGYRVANPTDPFLLDLIAMYYLILQKKLTADSETTHVVMCVHRVDCSPVLFLPFAP